MFYPTKDFILNNPIKHKKETIQAIIAWRNLNKNKPKKYNQIKQLIHILAKVYNKPIQVMFVTNSPSSYYDPNSETIYLVNNSIITALHEFAHHLYGSSESIACRWSIWLFTKAYPEAFQNLVWEGHMLKRKKYNAST